MKKKGGTSFYLKDFEGSNFGPWGYCLEGRDGGLTFRRASYLHLSTYTPYIWVLGKKY